MFSRRTAAHVRIPDRFKTQNKYSSVIITETQTAQHCFGTPISTLYLCKGQSTENPPETFPDVSHLSSFFGYQGDNAEAGQPYSDSAPPGAGGTDLGFTDSEEEEEERKFLCHTKTR